MAIADNGGMTDPVIDTTSAPAAQEGDVSREDGLVDHVRGALDAPVTLIEYGDFECPYCAAAKPVLEEVVAGSNGGVRLIFRNFPLFELHPYALTAALAAEAAGAQGAFWRMHDVLFAHQTRLSDWDLAKYATKLGLDGSAVIGDAAQPYGDKVEADFALAVAAGVQGTPTVFINDRLYEGRFDVAGLRRAVAQARG
jgi:protein-disulfide isomerase